VIPDVFEIVLAEPPVLEAALAGMVCARYRISFEDAQIAVQRTFREYSPGYRAALIALIIVASIPLEQSQLGCRILHEMLKPVGELN
jgi:hypothetical protein